MPINVFKKHPAKIITFSRPNRAILCGELKVMGSRPKVTTFPLKLKRVLN